MSHMSILERHIYTHTHTHIRTYTNVHTETVFYRMSMSSGIDGMAGMLPISHWANYPDIGITRPLLDVSRVSHS